MRNLPTKIYLVQTERASTDSTRYCGPRRFQRIYTNLHHARQFIEANPKRKYRLLMADVEWVGIERKDEEG